MIPLTLFTAFIEPIAHGLGCIVSSYMTNSVSKDTRVLVVYSSTISLFFLPFIFLFGFPQRLPLEVLPYILFIAFVNFSYVFPFYRALKESDTSNVTALFSLGQVIVPILAFFLVGEQLSYIQYLGFFVVTIASIGVSISPYEKLRLNKAFYYMLVVSIMFAVSGVFYKKVFLSVDWFTGFFWSTFLGAMMGLQFLWSLQVRKIILNEFTRLNRSWKAFVMGETLDWIGEIGSTLATSLLPVTLVRGIASSQALFVLLFSMIGKPSFGRLFKENLSYSMILWKTSMYISIIIGTVLII